MFYSKRIKIKRNFVSEIDQFLQELNNMSLNHSDSRIEEEQKYKRISALRDHKQEESTQELP